MPTSQATATLTATHEPTARLAATSHGPVRSLMEAWFNYQARHPRAPAPRNGAVVELPWPLRN